MTPEEEAEQAIAHALAACGPSARVVIEELKPHVHMTPFVEQVIFVACVGMQLGVAREVAQWTANQRAALSRIPTEVMLKAIIASA